MMLHFNSPLIRIGAIILIIYFLYAKYDNGDYSRSAYRSYQEDDKSAKYTLTIPKDKAYEDYSLLEKVLYKLADGSGESKLQVTDSIIQSGDRALITYKALEEPNSLKKEKIIIAGKSSDAEIPLAKYALGMEIGETREVKLVTQRQNNTTVQHELEITVVKKLS